MTINATHATRAQDDPDGTQGRGATTTAPPERRRTQPASSILGLLLRRELTEDFPKMSPQFLIQHLTTTLWNKHKLIFAVPSRIV